VILRLRPTDDTMVATSSTATRESARSVMIALMAA
jgi:hypothetical protein